MINMVTLEKEDLINDIEKALFYFEKSNVGNVTGADGVEFIADDWDLAIDLLNKCLIELKSNNYNTSDIDFIICDFLDKHNKDFDLFIQICQINDLKKIGVDATNNLTIKHLMKTFELKKSSMYRYMKKLLSDGLIEKHIGLDGCKNEIAYFVPSEKGWNVYNIIKDYI